MAYINMGYSLPFWGGFFNFYGFDVAEERQIGIT
ncbi:MAG: hypothetical protein RL732_1521 [Bacteroidota bacterium]